MSVVLLLLWFLGLVCLFCSVWWSSLSWRLVWSVLRCVLSVVVVWVLEGWLCGLVFGFGGVFV